MISEGFTRGIGEIWLDDVDCAGSENSLTECATALFGSHDCTHIEDAGVHCPCACTVARDCTECGSVLTKNKIHIVIGAEYSHTLLSFP